MYHIVVLNNIGMQIYIIYLYLIFRRLSVSESFVHSQWSLGGQPSLGSIVIGEVIESMGELAIKYIELCLSGCYH
jgi:hypothetical protein